MLTTPTTELANLAERGALETYFTQHGTADLRGQLREAIAGLAFLTQDSPACGPVSKLIDALEAELNRRASGSERVMMTAEKERFQAPGYRSDGELVREVGELNERLEGPYLTGDQRAQAEQRLSELQAEQAARSNARRGRNS